MLASLHRRQHQLKHAGQVPVVHDLAGLRRTPDEFDISTPAGVVTTWTGEGVSVRSVSNDGSSAALGSA